jgi:hypothetical protein
MNQPLLSRAGWGTRADCSAADRWRPREAFGYSYIDSPKQTRTYWAKSSGYL